MIVKLPPFVVNDANPIMSLSQNVDWGITKLVINELHQNGLTGKGIRIAVIDTGVENHPDLMGAVKLKVSTTVEAYASTNGHGTGVAGVIAARNNSTGVLGVAYESEIYSIKALDENGSGDLDAVVRAIDLAIHHKVHIINMSLGSNGTTTALKNAIARASQAGIIVVCAAGNAGSSNSVDYPARYIETFAVGAVNQKLEVSSFSSMGWEVDIAAPGERILTTWKNSSYAKVSGTSFAAPFTSGVFALLLQAGIKVNHEIVKSTAIDIEEPGQDVKSGHGLINPIAIYTGYKPKNEQSAVKTVINEDLLNQIDLTSKSLNRLYETLKSAKI